MKQWASAGIVLALCGCGTRLDTANENAKGEKPTFVVARERYQGGDLEGALEKFNKVHEEDPDDRRIYYWRGVCYAELERYEDALKEFTLSIEKQPKNNLAIYWRGMTYFALKDLDKSLADFDEAIRRVPDRAEWYFARSKVYEAMGEKDKAAVDRKRAQQVAAIGIATPDAAPVRLSSDIIPPAVGAPGAVELPPIVNQGSEAEPLPDVPPSPGGAEETKSEATPNDNP